MAFSKKTRSEMIEKMKTETLDLLIIGGGITGAGVALQAAASGLKTGLIEMQDFAEGTSSRSTKLVHGGIRYLKNFDVEVVADTVGERAVVQGIAPHIPKPDPMLLPIYDEPGSTFNMFSVKVAMDLYDRLAGVENGPYANYTLTKEEVVEREPQIRQEKLLGGGVYLDFRNNDARLVIENIKQSAADGGLMLSRVRAESFLYAEDGSINGVRALDLLTDEVFEIHAHVVINTTGPWSDIVRNLDTTHPVSEQMRPTKGVHLVVDNSKLTVPQPTYFDSGKQDGRMIFVIPRENKTYFGTTDTDYQGDFSHPVVEEEDVYYLLEAVNTHFPEVDITIRDIESSWAGIRPLIASNGGSDYNGGDNGSISDKSFEEVVSAVTDYTAGRKNKNEVEHVLRQMESSLSESENSPSAISRGSSLELDDSGLITLAGGKITDYRKMAEGAMKLILELLNKNFNRQFTLIDSKTYQVSGGHFDPQNVEDAINQYAADGFRIGLEANEANDLANLYGSNTPAVFELGNTMEAIPGLTFAQSLSLRYALEEEMVLTPVDYLLRRTNYMLFIREELMTIKEAVVDEMARYFDWTEGEKLVQEAQLDTVIAETGLEELKKIHV
ncbi:MAG: type 1 glycerol-3-phosphate oxidase [Lactobacillales bacterium]|jgi:alpha-glycerophosphate oxidase|nr:type 1 glycerol-3-phosphate oxidase [Lactobacillales bacterium]